MVGAFIHSFIQVRRMVGELLGDFRESDLNTNLPKSHHPKEKLIYSQQDRFSAVEKYPGLQCSSLILGTPLLTGKSYCIINFKGLYLSIKHKHLPLLLFLIENMIYVNIKVILKINYPI